MTDQRSEAQAGRGERWFTRVSAALMTVVVGAVFGTYVYGASTSPHHVTRGSVHLESPPEAVVAVLHDIEGRPDWRPNVVRIGRKTDPEDPREVWREMDAHDDRFDIEVLARGTDGLDLRTDSPEQIGYEATWTFRVSRQDGGTRVDVVEAGFVDNPLFRGVFWLRDGPREIVTNELTWLGAALEETKPLAIDVVVHEGEKLEIQ